MQFQHILQGLASTPATSNKREISFPARQLNTCAFKGIARLAVAKFNAQITSAGQIWL